MKRYLVLVFKETEQDIEPGNQEEIHYAEGSVELEKTVSGLIAKEGYRGYPSQKEVEKINLDNYKHTVC